MLICQLTDLHVRPAGMAACRVIETNMFAERAFRAVARFNPRPDVVLLTGDLTANGLDAEYARLARLIRKFLTMPVFVIPGNHDQREALRKGLQHLPGVTSDPQYVQYAVDDYPVRLVMLDTLVPGATHGELRGEQLEFLDRTLSACRTSRRWWRCTTRHSSAASPTWIGSYCATRPSSPRSSRNTGRWNGSSAAIITVRSWRRSRIRSA